MSGIKKRKLRCRPDAPPKHVRLYVYMLKSAAWRALSSHAAHLLIELQALYNGRNNGTLFLSIRDAARALKTGPRQAARAFDELIEQGFIRPTRKGAMATGGQKGLATTWLLTEHDDDVSGRKADQGLHAVAHP